MNRITAITDYTNVVQQVDSRMLIGPCKQQLPPSAQKSTHVVISSIIYLPERLMRKYLIQAILIVGFLYRA